MTNYRSTSLPRDMQSTEKGYAQYLHTKNILIAEQMVLGK